MCGIAGIVAAPGGVVDRAQLERMTDTLVHRGPDGRGIALPSPRVGLGHRRLSIIDLATGAQPMASPDGQVWITFNGEIFNYRELRPRLEARGRVFRTQSDTEVLLACYELDGPLGLRALRGQYAFAIWDERRRGGMLILARDPIGIKPMYWSHAKERILFASEPRAILAHADAPREIDPYGLNLFLRYRFIPASRTAWHGIHKLHPGELLVVEHTTRGFAVTSERPWHLAADDVECDDDDERAVQELQEALVRAVAREKVADVPVGAFLSGGIDSSTTAALLMRVSGAPITTFTIGFASKKHDESEYAAEVAAHLGSTHACRVMDQQKASEVVHEILAHLDEPFGDPSLVPTWFLCKLAAEQHKVVLSGDGGDELFGGYGRVYRALNVLSLPGALRPLHRLLQRLLAPSNDPARWHGDDARVGDEYVRLLADLDDREAKRLYGPRLAKALGPAWIAEHPLHEAVARYSHLPPFSRILMADMEAHLADYHLVKVERASMAHGLEARVPFLDLDLVQRVFRWTARVRLRGNRTKGLLRDAVAPWLPSTVLTREKKGFGPPLSDWFEGGLGAFARDGLLDGAAVQMGYLQRSEVARMLDPSLKSLKGSRIWRLLVLEHWLRRQSG